MECLANGKDNPKAYTDCCNANGLPDLHGDYSANIGASLASDTTSRRISGPTSRTPSVKRQIQQDDAGPAPVENNTNNRITSQANEVKACAASGVKASPPQGDEERKKENLDWKPLNRGWSHVDEELRKKGYITYNPAGDGDCFYSSLLWLLDEERKISVLDLRAKAAAYLAHPSEQVDMESEARAFDSADRPNPYRRKDGAVLSKDEYIELVKQPKMMWADDFVIEAMLQNLYPFETAGIQLRGTKFFYDQFLSGSFEPNAKCILLINNHFVAFRGSAAGSKGHAVAPIEKHWRSVMYAGIVGSSLIAAPIGLCLGSEKCKSAMMRRFSSFGRWWQRQVPLLHRA